MKMLNTSELQHVQSKIYQLPSGRYELSDILGEDWQNIDCPTEYGRLFRRTAALGLVKAIKHVGRKSNNHLVYQVCH